MNHTSKDQRAALLVEYQRLMKRNRKVSRVIPQALPVTNQQEHLSIAIFESWFDDLITDSYFEECFSSHKGCLVCEDNLSFYRAQKEQKATLESAGF